MKGLVLVLAMAMAGSAFANELDQEATNATQLTAEQAKAMLPATTVIRVSKQDPSKVEVVHLKTKLNKGEKLSDKVKFEQVALNTEITGINFDSSNELDATSSTSAWRYGYGGAGFIARGPNGGVVAGGARWGGGYGGYGYGRPYYGYGAGYYGGYNPYNYGYGWNYPNYYTINSGCYNNYNCYDYAATYRVAAYSYVAQPYYTYADPYYNYIYCGW